MLVYKQLLNYKEISADEAEITLINKNEYHYESTWLHEASAGTINYEDLLYPVESAVKQDKVNFVVAEVTKLTAMLNASKLTREYMTTIS